VRAPDKPTIRRSRGRPPGSKNKRPRQRTRVQKAADAAAAMTWWAWGPDGKPYHNYVGPPCPLRPPSRYWDWCDPNFSLPRAVPGGGIRFLTVSEAAWVVAREWGLTDEEYKKFMNILRTGRTKIPTATAMLWRQGYCPEGKTFRLRTRIKV
jgi:hypothetical protein